MQLHKNLAVIHIGGVDGIEKDANRGFVGTSFLQQLNTTLNLLEEMDKAKPGVVQALVILPRKQDIFLKGYGGSCNRNNNQTFMYHTHFEL